MLQPPPSPSPSTGAEPLLFVVHELSVVAEITPGGIEFPSATVARSLAGTEHFVGMLGERPVHAAELRLDAPAKTPTELPAPLSLVPARRTLFSLRGATLDALGQALAIGEWSLTSRFCGRCAAPTEAGAGERLRVCPACRSHFRPRVPPAVIVLVEHEGRALLARSPGFPRGVFGLVAGFVEPGETLEEAAAREVREEVGLEIRGLRYMGSQAWPFGRSLMVGFRATAAAGELVLDANEIEEAAFYDRENMPGLPPIASIARRMIDAWLAEPTE